MVKFDIYDFSYPYEDNPTKSKYRPVIILEIKANLAYLGTITSGSPRNDCDNEYEIVNWKQAGLKTKSTFRGSKYIKVPISQLQRCKKYGQNVQAFTL